MPYEPHTLFKRLVKPAIERAKLGSGIGWYTFRRSYATMLVHHGGEAKVTQELMRHADFRTTMNLYAKGVHEDLRQANRKVVQVILAPKSLTGTEN